MKKALAFILVAVILTGMLAGCGSSQQSSPAPAGNAEPAQSSGQAPAAEPQKPVTPKNIMLGSSPATSVVYPFGVAVADAIMAAYPGEYNISVTETSGSVGAIQQVESGSLDMGNTVMFSSYEDYMGIGSFEGNPNKDARVLWCYEINQNTFCVSEESGISSLYELDGQRYNPGGTGTAAAVITQAVLNLIEVEPKYFEASQADAADAYANRQIVGTTKLGPPPDSYILQLNANLPVRILDVPEDVIALTLENYPYLISVKVNGGTYDWIDYDYQTVATMVGYQTQANLISQEDGYKFMSAICSEEGKAILAAGYPLCAGRDICEYTANAPIPLHPGVVQYLLENGYEVAEELIPPEYVPVS